MRAARAKLVLHRYFVLPELEGSAASASPGWIDMIKLRLRKWAKLQAVASPGEVGYHRLEKDKCAAQSFLRGIGVPTVDVLWSRTDSTWERGDFEALLQGSELRYPVIIKLGHLQQSLGLRVVRSSVQAVAELPKLVAWVEQGFRQRFSDDIRSWVADANVLYQAVKPCVLVQPLLSNAWMDPKGKVFELKVEVVWGRAYLGFVETRVLTSTLFGVVPLAPQSALVVLRDGLTTRYVEWPKRFRWEQFWPWDEAFQYLANRPHTDAAMDPLLQQYLWLTPSVVQTAFALSERVARRLGADEVRVDLFINPHDPANPVVNEISFSSGHYYRYHNEKIAAWWAEGHRTGGYRRVSDGSIPVDEL